MDSSACLTRIDTSSTYNMTSPFDVYGVGLNSPRPTFDIRQKVVNRLYKYLELPGTTTKGSTGDNSHTEEFEDQDQLHFSSSPATYSCSVSSSSLRQSLWSSSETQVFSSWPTPPRLPPVPAPPPPINLSTRIQSYATAEPCEHVNHRKRLRVKKGYIYYVCLCCGAKWRIPAHRRAHNKELQQAAQQAKLDELMRNLEI